MQALNSVSEKQDNPTLGIFWMMMTMLLFVSMDSLAKYLSQSLPVPQVVWARFFFHVVWLGLFFRAAILPAMKSVSPKLQLLRSALLVCTTTLFFTGLRITDLSTATCIMFLSPIFVTVLAIPILGEKVGPRRIFGVLLGFMGAIIIVWRSPVGALHSGSWIWQFELGHLLIICAALSNALYQIMTRHLGQLDLPLTSLFYSGFFGSIATTLWLPTVWVTPDVLTLGLLTLVGLFGCISHFCLIRAFAYAPASVVVPFSYSSLIWATIIGFVVFKTLPDQQTLLGASLIIASGLYIFYREHQLERS